jgi:hypothetical protein
MLGNDISTIIFMCVDLVEVEDYVECSCIVALSHNNGTCVKDLDLPTLKALGVSFVRPVLESQFTLERCAIKHGSTVNKVRTARMKPSDCSIVVPPKRSWLSSYQI